MSHPPCLPARRPTRGAVPKAVVVAVCLVALAISAWVLYRQAAPTQQSAVPGAQLQWACEGCQSGYTSPATGALATCPKCGKVGDLVHTFRCTRCDAAFEGYRMRFRKGQPPLLKTPKGEWTEDRGSVEAVVCPTCGKSDAAELVSPPPI